ncbi:MAG TPA: hypothetical protein VLA37_01740, partial [Sphingomonadaceae bacterium]|nr:hypothetical protein [Sphingomonadaceae bacterium]
MTIVRLLLMAGVAWLAWSCARPRVDTPPPGSGYPGVKIYLVAHEGRTGIVVPRAEIPAAVYLQRLVARRAGPVGEHPRCEGAKLGPIIATSIFRPCGSDGNG